VGTGGVGGGVGGAGVGGAGAPHEVSVHDAHWQIPESAHTAPLKVHNPARGMHVCESQHHSWPNLAQLSHVRAGVGGARVGGGVGGVGTGVVANVGGEWLNMARCFSSTQSQA
jgi:hypothetical protein